MVAFSLVGSRSLVVVRSFGVPLCAPWWRVLVGSALASGAVRWRLRSSPRSFSGAVVVVGFSSPVVAGAFAAAWSGWVGFPCAVRLFAGGVWGVSVPIAAPPSSPCAAVSPPPVLPPRSWVGG